MHLMKSIPGGTLLIPMLLAALLNTFCPDVFKIGGITEALFSGNSLNFILGAAVFISGCSLNLQTLPKVMKRYGSLLLFRTFLVICFSLLFNAIFGLPGVLGISSIAFICTLTSINPTLFLALVSDCGDEVDKSAFAFVSLFATPILPIFIYSLTSPASLDFRPLISTLIPLVVGIILGNLDKELGEFLASGMPFMIICLGWSVGTGINLLEAWQAGFSGIIMTILYYVLSFVPLFFFEKIALQRNGISATALSTMAGLSAAVPLILAKINAGLSVYAPNAAAIVTLGLVLSSLISPFLVRRLSGVK